MLRAPGAAQAAAQAAAAQDRIVVKGAGTEIFDGAYEPCQFLPAAASTPFAWVRFSQQAVPALRLSTPQKDPTQSRSCSPNRHFSQIEQMYQKQTTNKGILLILEDIQSNLFNLYKTYSQIFLANYFQKKNYNILKFYYLY